MAVVKINAIHVPEDSGPELEKRFAAHGDSMLATPGFLGYELLRPIEGEHRYFVYTRWESDEAFEAWRTGGAAEAVPSGQRAQPVATGADLLQFEVALSVGKGGGES
jgi:heme oxygenase (mycobilin-producing)